MADGVLAPPRTLASSSGAGVRLSYALSDLAPDRQFALSFSWHPHRAVEPRLQAWKAWWCVGATGRWHRVHESNAARGFWRPACSRSTRQTQRPQDRSPAASVWLLNFPVACYILPPPRTKTVGRYACGRPSVKLSIDSSTHQDRRGFRNGAIACRDCLVSARVTTSETPMDNSRVKIPPGHSSCQEKLSVCCYLEIELGHESAGQGKNLNGTDHPVGPTASRR